MGSKKSATETNTTSTYYDQRSVNDAGGGIIGTGNQWDQSLTQIDGSSTTWQQYTDSSNRSTTNWADNSQTNWTQNTDNSNRSTNNWSQSTSSNWNDNSQTNWTQNTDNSNRSTTNWTQNTDSSNRSTNNWTQTTDASDRSTTNIQVVDGGQTEAARRIAEAAIAAARDSSSGATDAAIKAQQAAISSNDRALSGALGFAESASAAAFKSSSDAMGWAGQRFDEIASLTGDLLKASQKNADSAASNVAAAYNSAASQSNGNKTLTIAALAAVGLVAALVVFKKG